MGGMDRRNGNADWMWVRRSGAKLMSSGWKWACWPQLKALTGVLPGIRTGPNHQAKDWSLGLTLRGTGHAWALWRPGVWGQPG